jgi:hypothetical protein
MAAGDAEGSLRGVAALAGAWLGDEAELGGVLGDAAVEQAAIAIASAGPKRAMVRFMESSSFHAFRPKWGDWS